MTATETYPRDPLVDEKGLPDPTLPGGWKTFFAIVGVLALLRVVVGMISLPRTALPAVNTLLAILFVAVPVFACFFSSNYRWKPMRAVWFLLAGVAVHALFAVGAFYTKGIPSGVLNAISQVGMATWCVGLGSLLGSALRDKNLVLPVAIFGAAYDIYLVLTPAGITNKALKAAPAIFQGVAAQVPAVSATPATGKAEVLAYVGPADLVFLTAFFVIIFKFSMNPRLTLALMVPALAAYLLAVLAFGIALPALVPIGLCVLIANWRYFQLSKSEVISTLGLAGFCALFILWGLSRRQAAEQEQPVEPSPQAAVPAPRGSEARPGTSAPGPRPSTLQTAPGSTKGRR